LGGPGKRKEDQELRALHVLQASIVSKKRRKKKERSNWDKGEGVSNEVI
jgi:hypothetical protein